MNIDIRTFGFAPTDAILAHVRRRVSAALGWAADAVGVVTVRLDDVNADRGGVDKRCRIVAPLRGRRSDCVADVVSNDLYAAVDEAASRVRRVAVRRLSRRISLDRKDPQRPGTLVAAGSG